MPKLNLTGGVIKRDYDREIDQGPTCTDRRLCGEIAKGWPSLSQGEKPQRKPALSAPQTFQAPEL